MEANYKIEKDVEVVKENGISAEKESSEKVESKDGAVFVEEKGGGSLLSDYANKSVDELLSQISEILEGADEKGYVRLDDFIKVFSAVEALRLKLKSAPAGFVSVNVDELAKKINSYDVLLVNVEEEELLEAIKYYSGYSDKFQKIVDLLKKAVNDPFVLSVLKGDVLLSELEKWVKKSESLEEVPQLARSVYNLKDEVVNLRVAIDDVKKGLESVDEKVKKVVEETVNSKVKEAVEEVKEDVFVDTTNKISSLKAFLKDSLKEASKQIAQKVLSVTEGKIETLRDSVLKEVEELIDERVKQLTSESVEAIKREVEERLKGGTTGDYLQHIDEINSRLAAVEATISDHNLRTLIQEIVSQELSKLAAELSLGSVKKVAENKNANVLNEPKSSFDEHLRKASEEEESREEEESQEEEREEESREGADKTFYVNVGLIAVNLIVWLLKIL